MVDKITSFLESNLLLRSSQHGFRRQRSCLTNLIEFFHFVFSEHDKDKAVDVIYLDFQKAFDTVQHAAIWEALQSQKVPSIYIMLLKKFTRTKKVWYPLTDKASHSV